MEKLKARISKLKEDIDACEQRESEAKALHAEAKNRLELAESERNSFRRRLKIIEGDVAKTNERLAEKQDRLDSLESQTAEHDTARKNLEDQEVEGDERLVQLSDQLKRGQTETEAYDTQYSEAKRREVVLLADLDKAESRYADNSARIEQLMKAIANASEDIRDLESRESDQCDRETLNEEKVVFLSEQIKETLSKAESSERDAARLKRLVTNILAEIGNWKNKTADVFAEMEDVNNMADGIEY
jgi:tropomyosin-1